MSTTPTTFSNVADFEKYANQFVAQIQLPSYDEMYQLFATCFATIEQHMPQAAKPVDKLSLKQIALLHIYNGKAINGINSNSIAVAYGHNSGRKLSEHYCSLTDDQERTKVTGRQATNRLKDIAAIKHKLDKEALVQAEQEEREIKLRC